MMHYIPAATPFIAVTYNAGLSRARVVGRKLENKAVMYLILFIEHPTGQTIVVFRIGKEYLVPVSVQLRPKVLLELVTPSDCRLGRYFVPASWSNGAQGKLVFHLLVGVSVMLS